MARVIASVLSVVLPSGPTSGRFGSMPQLTLNEENLIDQELRKRAAPMDILAKVNAKRQRLEVEPASKQTIYRYVNGDTHRRGRPETRGRKKVLAKRDVRTIDQTRRRLIQKADSQERVTWAQVHKASGLKKKVSQRSMEDAIRATGVRFRTARKKIFIAKDDAKARAASFTRALS